MGASLKRRSYVLLPDSMGSSLGKTMLAGRGSSTAGGQFQFAF
jgi:hypothetical protein